MKRTAVYALIASAIWFCVAWSLADNPPKETPDGHR